MFSSPSVTAESRISTAPDSNSFGVWLFSGRSVSVSPRVNGALFMMTVPITRREGRKSGGGLRSYWALFSEESPVWYGSVYTGDTLLGILLNFRKK